MKPDVQRLIELLPEVLRTRDQAAAVPTPGLLSPTERLTLTTLLGKEADKVALTNAEKAAFAALAQAAQAGPLASLIGVVAEQFALLEEDLDQLYDDQFIETCAEWVAPYIGDLISYEPLTGPGLGISSPRAEVAHTIAYRRRKGTISVVEQLARDVTGWPAGAVEYFQRLIVSQYMNHVRPECLATPDLRDGRRLEQTGRAFDAIGRTVDMRTITSGRGRHNIPNIGVFLWRVNAQPLSRSPAAMVDARRGRFHPLGLDQPLLTLPWAEEEITELATPANAPVAISRRAMDTAPDDYYTGPDDIPRSLRLYEDSSGTMQAVPAAAICVCNLSDHAGAWAHLPPVGKFAIDPELGRLALPPGLAASTRVWVDFHYGAAANIGGGEYDRDASFELQGTPPQLEKVPDQHATIAAALAALGAKGGVVEITDSGHYAEALTIAPSAKASIELRAASGCRPTLILTSPMTLMGKAESEVRLNGLLIAGGPIDAPAAGNELHRLVVSHCTLVPGGALAPDATPPDPAPPALQIAARDVDVTLDRVITGGLRVDSTGSVSARDSIIDATSTTQIAYAGPDGLGPGAPLKLEGCTVIGKIHALILPLVTNAILLARLAPGDVWPAPVIAARRQEGCIRFSYAPSEALVPRRHRCLPEAAGSPELAAPRMVSLRYGHPAYALPAASAGPALLTGADDEGQPGAYHHLHEAQRVANLRIRLDEYIRAGLEAGIFFER